MRFLIGLLVALCLAGAARAGGLTGATVTATGGGAEVVIRFDAPTDRADIMALAAPNRIVVDLPGSRAAGGAITGAGPVEKVRTAQFSPTQARVVLDLSAPLAIGAAAFGADGRTLTLRLDASSADAFGRLAKAPRRTIRGAATETAAAAPAPASAPAPTPTPAPAAQQPQPAPAAPPPAAASAPTPPRPAASTPAPSQPPPAAPRPSPPRVSADVRGARPLVVIDAGHGGHDTGAISVFENRREKDVTLAIAKAVVAEINASGRVRAVLTRNDDRFLVLGERVEVARRQRADLFISIHADSAANADASGATVYTLSEVSSDREAARLAAKENKSDIINGVDLGREAGDVSSILIDLAQRETMNMSSAFAALMQRELAPYVKFKTDFHRFAGFRVLKAADTPAVLLETGYLSNVEDAKFLVSKKGQDAIATGVRKAVEAHFARRQAQR